MKRSYAVMASEEIVQSHCPVRKMYVSQRLCERSSPNMMQQIYAKTMLRLKQASQNTANNNQIIQQPPKENKADKIACTSCVVPCRTLAGICSLCTGTACTECLLPCRSCQLSICGNCAVAEDYSIICRSCQSLSPF